MKIEANWTCFFGLLFLGPTPKTEKRMHERDIFGVKSYMMVLAGMSVIPIIAFIGFSLCVSSILVGIGITFVLTWGSVIIGCAFFALMISLAFLVAAAFWVVVGLFMTIFVLRLMYNVQTSFVHKVKHSQVIKELVNHANEKRLHHHQQNDMAEDVKSS
ncbi:hypothetical protein PGT21_028552 [Puccinia graminis f. sp. tritici]|uniref:Uncharacterized protein n=1 Tax=Puccinia graminis f. sp. tritici TaxID=56615 RepID=A0A5B0NPH2_PUCGR|nr:hypothetical protein PGT21_028552 [Puccinia graminis f. sp. tritici]